MNATNRVLMVILAAVLLLGAYLVVSDGEGTEAATGTGISDVRLINDPQYEILYVTLDTSYSTSSSYEITHMEDGKSVRDHRGLVQANKAQLILAAPDLGFVEGVDYTIVISVPNVGKLTATFTLPEDNYYYVEFYVDGEIVREDTQIVQYMETAVEPAEPKKDGATFVGWLAEDGEIFEFDTPITEGTLLTASFVPFVPPVPKVYTITIDPEIRNGTVFPDKTEAEEGETVTLTVTPAEGFIPAAVTVNGETIEGASFEMPASDVIVSAAFIEIPIIEKHAISVDTEMVGGDVTPDKYLVAAGATVTLTYTEDEGYTFDSYYAYAVSSDEAIIVADDGTFTMPADDVIVGAIFLPDLPVEKYTVTVLPSENGTASADVTEAEENDQITITATPDDGYQTVAIYVDGQPLLEGEITFLMPAKDVEISAVFAEVPVGGSTVTYVDVNGFVETESYEIGEEVVYHVATVPEGMELGYVYFEPWMAFGIDQEACTVEFTAVEGNYTAMISYIAPYTVYLVDQDGKSIDYFQYFAEDSVELDVGYTFGVEVESATSEPEIEDLECEDGVITFTMPAEDVTVTVTLKPIVPETATVVFIDGITEEEVATETVIVGAYLTEIPNEPVHEGMTFTGWYREGSDVPYDFATMPVMENMTLYADYVETPVVEEYIITVYSKIENGSVTADKEKAQAGETVTLTNTPAEGYVFNGYTVLTEAMMPVVVEDDGTFVMPAENVTVFADFQPETVITYTVSYVDQDGKTIATSEKYEEGDYVSFFIPARTGADAVKVETDPEVEAFDYDLELMIGAFTMPASDVTVTVTYEAFVPPVPVFYDAIVKLDGEVIEDDQFTEGEPVVYDLNEYILTGVEATVTGPEGLEYEFEEGVLSFEMPAADVEFTLVLKPIVPVEKHTVTYVDQDGNAIGDAEEREAGESVFFEVPERAGADVDDVTSEPEVADFVYIRGLVTFTMPEYDVKVIVTYVPYLPPVPETVDVTFYVGEEVYGEVQTVAVGECAVEPEDDPVLAGATFIGWYTSEGELFDFETPVTEDLDLYAEFVPFVAPVSVTFMDGEAVIDTVFVEIGGLVEEVPEAPVKEGYNFVGWCVNDIPTAIDFSELPIVENMVVYATYVETPDIGEGYAILYHDMYKGKPVDIWWKGYASKDDRVMLANGMDATAIFMGWLAEDQETLFSWNAAYDLNDIERNDCLIYPASYGYPGTDRIYELNAIYALEIEWISFDGETVLKTDEVIRGDNLEAPLDDEEMQDLLQQYKPSSAESDTYWAGWNIPGVGTYSSADVEFIKANGSWQIFATYGTEVKEYDITFNWHDGTDTQKVAYGDTPEIADPEGYVDDNFTYTFAGWDHEVTPVKGDDTYNATYVKTSKTKEVTITVNCPDYGYFTYGDEELTEKVIEVPMDFGAADIDEDVLTFDLLFYLLDVPVPMTEVFTAVPKADDTMHYEFVEWTVSDDGNTYTANFVTDIITSKDLDRIQTFFDYTKTEGGDVVFTLKSKDGLAIPKGTMTVWYYEIAYLEDIEDWVQIERSCDAIAMDWDEDTYGENLISMTIEYADLTQDGEAFDITSKTISTMWLVFDGVNGAHCESNKATPGQ